MKPKVVISIAVLLALFSGVKLKATPEGDQTSAESQLQLFCSPRLSELVGALAAEYGTAHPAVQVSVTSLSAIDLNQRIMNGGLAFATKNCVEGTNWEDAWKIKIGREGIVPVINANNPFKEEICKNGISPEEFTALYTGGSMAWGTLTGKGQSERINAYVPADAVGKSYLAGFISEEPERILGTETAGPEEMRRCIVNDPYAIGFCSLDDILREEPGGSMEGFILVPVDMNNNGRVDPFEEIYGDGHVLAHALRVGKYPVTLYSRLYAVSGERPHVQTELSFLEWILTEGEEMLASSGFLAMENSERHSVLTQLQVIEASTVQIPVKAYPSWLIPLFIGILVFAVIVMLVVAILNGRRNSAARGEKDGQRQPLKESNFNFPGGLYFDRSHTWAFMEKDGQVRVGIDNFLLQVTGAITSVKMKSAGEVIQKGEVLATLVQYGKQLEIKSPVSGIVSEQNLDLINDATILNTAPYSEGWICMVKPYKWMTELKAFLMGEPYGEWIRGEFDRLKVFFISVVTPQGSHGPVLLMQDGGELIQGALELAGPEVWEEFQAGFINKSS